MTRTELRPLGKVADFLIFSTFDPSQLSDQKKGPKMVHYRGALYLKWRTQMAQMVHYFCQIKHFSQIKLTHALVLYSTLETSKTPNSTAGTPYMVVAASPAPIATATHASTHM